MNEFKNATKKFSHQLPTIQIAEVVDNKDPYKRGRVRVRIMGVTDEKLPKGKCPFAEQVVSSFAGSLSSTGISSVPDVGTFVYIQFLHGDPSHPVYTGTVAGGKMKTANLAKNHKGCKSDFDSSRESNKLDNEPEIDSSSSYPNCNVIETRNGNVVILDDSDNNTRVIIGHGKSASYFEIKNNGDIVMKTNGDSYEIVKSDSTLQVDGSRTEKIKEDRTVDIKKSEKITVGEDFELNVEGDINIKASGDIKLNGTSIALTGSTPINVMSNGKSIVRTGDKDTHNDTNLPPS